LIDIGSPIEQIPEAFQYVKEGHKKVDVEKALEHDYNKKEKEK
jgi:hypothetical protein